MFTSCAVGSSGLCQKSRGGIAKTNQNIMCIFDIPQGQSKSLAVEEGEAGGGRQAQAAAEPMVCSLSFDRKIK